MVIVIVFSFILIIIVNIKLKGALDNYINIESERIVSHVINQSIKDINFPSNYYLKNNDGNISYNFSNINIYKEELTKRIQNYFSLIESGDYSKYPLYTLQYNKSKYNKIRKGYLCEMSFNALFNSVIFANVGPTIPVKLSFVGNVSVNLDVKTKEYGINNAIVEIYADVDIINKISMPIVQKKINVSVKEPIVVDIVKGNIPDYYVR